MSSRSIGVTKVRLSFLMISCVISFHAGATFIIAGAAGVAVIASVVAFRLER